MPFIALLLSLILSFSAYADGPDCAQAYAHLLLDPASDLKAFHEQVLKITRDLPPGSKLDFGGGDIYHFEKLLGQGATTKIVKTKEGPVLRISMRNPAAYPGTDLGGFDRLQGELEAAGVPVVKVDRTKSRPPKFLVVEEKKIQGTLDQILHPGFSGISEEDRKVALKRLEDFARKTWGFQYIGDFNGGQLGYDGKEWFLFDFGMSNSPIAHPRQTKNVFSSFTDDGDLFRHVPAELEAKLTNVIQAERALHEGKELKPWFTRMKYDEDYDLLMRNESTGPVFNHLSPYEVDKDFLTKRGKKKLLEKASLGYRDIKMKFTGLVKSGEKSALYSVSIGKKEGLLELRYDIGKKKDLYSGKMPLLKDAGYSDDDLLAIGPDYVLVFK